MKMDDLYKFPIVPNREWLDAFITFNTPIGEVALLNNGNVKIEGYVPVTRKEFEQGFTESIHLPQLSE